MYAFITDKENNRLFQKRTEPSRECVGDNFLFFLKKNIPNDHSTDVTLGRSPCMLVKLGCANNPKSYVGGGL